MFSVNKMNRKLRNLDCHWPLKANISIRALNELKWLTKTWNNKNMIMNLIQQNEMQDISFCRISSFSSK